MVFLSRHGERQDGGGNQDTGAVMRTLLLTHRVIFGEVLNHTVACFSLLQNRGSNTCSAFLQAALGIKKVMAVNMVKAL